MYFRTTAQRLLASAAALAISTFSAGASGAYAAEADPAKPEAAKPESAVLGEIVVTANKREENLSKVGLTVTALGATQLKQQKITTLQDLASAVPGLTYTLTDSSTPVYTLRGIGFYDTTLGAYPSVSVYLDEAPLSFPVLTTGTLFDIERVEVLKGPQGTLFGNNATGGAINYIAAKPTRDFNAGATLDYARFNTFTGDAYVSGPLTDNLLARVAVKASDGDGWQRSISRPDDKNGAPKTAAGRFLLDWRPTTKLRVQTDLNGWIDQTQPTQAQFVKYVPDFPLSSPLPVPLVPNAVNNAQLAEWTPLLKPSADNRLLQATARIDYDVTNAIVLTSLTSDVDYTQRQVPLGDGNPVERIDVYVNNGSIHSFSTELRLADNADPVFRWTLGANYSHDTSYEYDGTVQTNSSSNHTSVFAGLPFAGNAFDNHQVMNNYAVFAAGEYTLGPVTLKASARYTEADRTTANCNLGFVQGPGPNNILAFFNILTGVNNPAGSCTILDAKFQLHEFQGVLNQNNLSWRIGGDWKITDNILGYALIAKGYKAGSFPALSGSFDLAYTPVTQESVLDYEGGVKAQLFEHKLSVNVSGFYNEYLNKQIKSALIDPTFGPLDALVNIPKSSIKGAELEVTARPVSGLTVGGAVTYLDATLDKADGIIDLLGVAGNWDGNPIPRTSKWNVNGNINYRFSVGARTAFVGGQVAYRSSSTSSIGNESEFLMPGYTTLDLQAGLDLKDGKTRIMVWGKNVTNTFYLTNISKYTDGIQRFAGMPVTYGASVSYKF